MEKSAGQDEPHHHRRYIKQQCPTNQDIATQHRRRQHINNECPTGSNDNKNSDGTIKTVHIICINDHHDIK